MANKMLIDATHPEETRVVVVRGQKVEEFDFESANRRQLRGNIYLAKVIRVEPSLQAAFVEYGGNRHGFLAFGEIHPDYYQIPVADRQALLEEDARHERDMERDEERRRGRRPRERSRGRRGDSRIASRGEEPDPIEAVDVGEQLTAAGTEGGEDWQEQFAPAGAADAGQAADSAEPRFEVGAGEAAEPADHAITQPHGEKLEVIGSEPNQAAEAAAPAETADHSVTQPHGDKLEVIGSEPEQAERMDDIREAHSEHDSAQHAHAEHDMVDDAARRTGEPEHEDAGEDEDDAEGENGDEEEEVQQVGGRGDAMEELPERPRPPRRQYKIQEVIKRRQILLVQVVKEERGNKGAALTTYLSLAGRYSVLMPNTGRGGGISRKITDSADRKRLKEIAQELQVPEGMGIILRTAGASRTKPEIKRDYEYLMRMWESVRELTLSSTAPALVYEEGSLIKRAIRDLYNKDIDDVLVAGEEAYREAKDFMRMLAPSSAKAVQPYRDPQPLFARHGIEQQLDAMFSSHVTLKSGGYLVINPTEALVSIDVNSGRSTREHNIEDTALRTNMEAAEEIARQLRLRDLAGLIVIDFIDMEEKRNNRSVEKKLNDCLKNDRARIQVGRISPFGLLEMSRQRIRTGVLESSSVPCPHCGGTGSVRATPSVALHILRSIEETLLKSATHNVVVRTRAEVAFYMLNQKRGHVRELEERFGVTILVQVDPALAGGINFAVDRGEPAQRPEEKPRVATVQIDALPPIDEDEEADAEADEGDEDAEEQGENGARAEGDEAQGEAGARRRRRRRRRRGPGREGEIGEGGLQAGHAEEGLEPSEMAEGDEAEEGPEGDETPREAASGEGRPERDRDERGGRRRRRGRRGGRRDEGEGGREPREPRGPRPERDSTGSGSEPEAQPFAPQPAYDELPVPQAASAPVEPEPVQELVPQGHMTPEAPVAQPNGPAAEPEAPAPGPAPEPVAVVLTPPDPDRPKRAGWWSKAKAALGGN
jgi:ribonuclease E